MKVAEVLPIAELPIGVRFKLDRLLCRPPPPEAISFDLAEDEGSDAAHLPPPRFSFELLDAILASVDEAPVVDARALALREHNERERAIDGILGGAWNLRAIPERDTLRHLWDTARRFR